MPDAVFVIIAEGDRAVIISEWELTPIGLNTSEMKSSATIVNDLGVLASTCMHVSNVGNVYEGVESDDVESDEDEILEKHFEEVDTNVDEQVDKGKIDDEKHSV